MKKSQMFKIPKDVQRAVGVGRKFYGYGVVLNQVANFYNSLATEIGT